MKEGHSFSKKDGYTGSAGMVPVRSHFRSGGPVKVHKENVVDVVQKHVNSPIPPAHKTAITKEK
jgi:hypothetical protein